MHMPKGFPRMQAPAHDEQLPSLQDIYAIVMGRASATMRTVGILAAIAFTLWGLGFVVVIVLAVVFTKRYLRQHRVVGTLVRYQEYGDWVVVELEDGTQVAAHCALAGLPQGTEVGIAVRRAGVYVVSPSIGSDEAIVLALEVSE